MDRLDQEIINNIINTETMKNGSTNKSVYSSSSSSRGCSSPTLAAVIVILAIFGWIYAIGSACVSSCNSKNESSYSYTPRRSYSSYSSRSDSSYGAKYDEDGNIEVPYIGMSESKIKETSLGAPSGNVRHNNQVKNGEQYVANLYDFYDENGSCIFTARCVLGSVTEVWDNRDNPVAPYRSYSSSSKSKSKSKSSDPYHTKDYSEIDDFYDDYYDDFESFEDAEDYYNEHSDD